MRREPTGPGQESVWDYPRPPRVEPTDERVRVRLHGQLIADSRSAVRMLETSHPPTYYVPMSDFSGGVLRPASGTSFCEFKGTATYFDLVTDGGVVARSAWTYPDPTEGFEMLRDRVAIYPAAMDECLVDEEVVRPQAGGFYGGWVTDRVTGPFKGGPGTAGW